MRVRKFPGHRCSDIGTCVKTTGEVISCIRSLALRSPKDFQLIRGKAGFAEVTAIKNASQNANGDTRDGVDDESDNMTSNFLEYLEYIGSVGKLKLNWLRTLMSTHTNIKSCAFF